MILRFGVENYRSFRDPVEVSFVSTSRKEEPGYRLDAQAAQHGVLPVIGIWGGNATGKSTLLEGLQDLRLLVERSFTSFGPDQKLPWTPWRLERGDDAAPTTLTLDLLVEGVHHHYGVKYRSSGVLEEWLFYWPEAKRRVLFHRNHDDKKEPWYTGPSFKGPKRQIQQITDATRRNSLFLSAAAQYNHTQLGPVAKAISHDILPARSLPSEGFQVFFHDSPFLKKDQQEFLVSLLIAADVGVSGARLSKNEEATKFYSKLHSQAAGAEAAHLSKPSVSEASPLYELRLVHGRDPAEGWELPPQFESQGTHTFVAWAELLMRHLSSGRLFVVDEIEKGMHPDLVTALISLFVSPESNPAGAQLLFTSHDQSLLNHLRSDEILLVDKTKEGVSQISAASDYKEVRSRDDLRRAYIQGKMRGLPVLGDLPRIFGEALNREQ